MPWTPEEARENARKGGKARAAKRKAEQEEAERKAQLLANMSDEELATEAEKQFRDAAPTLAERLIEAAHGRGVFAELKASDQLGAILRCLEYGVGKPTANPKEKPKPKEDEPERGLQVV